MWQMVPALDPRNHDYRFMTFGGTSSNTGGLFFHHHGYYESSAYGTYKMRVLLARYEGTPVSHRRFWSGSSVQYGFAQWSAIAPDPVAVKRSSTVKEQETFMPQKYYQKKAPKFHTPNTSYTNNYYNEYTGKFEQSVAYYDFAGRQVIRIDWTNHGYSNHGNPHIHVTIYNARYPNGTSERWD